MAKKRKKSTRKRKVKNPASPTLRTGRMIPVQGVLVNKRGVVQKVVVRDKDMAKAFKRPTRKK